MSPICLINVAEIRDHALPLPEVREPVWHARVLNWMALRLRICRG